MSGLFRSQPMRYCSIMMRSECAHDTLREIGEHGFFHPVDLSDPLDLAESAKVAKKRIDDCRTWTNRIQKFRDFMQEFNVTIPTEDYTEEKGGDPELLGMGDLIEALQRHVDPREEELSRNIQFQRQTKQEIVHSIQHQHVLRVVAELQLEDMDEKSEEPSYYTGAASTTIGTPLLGADFGQSLEMQEVKGAGGTRFHSYVCGVINQNAQPLFARMLFRISRGNAISGFSPIPGGIVDGSDGENPVPKSVFYIMLTGQQLKTRITRLCANFEAAVYDTPQTREGFERKMAELERKSSDQRTALQQTEFAIVQLLQNFAGTASLSPLHTFELALRKEEAINITLLKCRFTYLHSCSACMIYMEGWCPKIEVNNLMDRLNLAFRNVEPAPIFTVDPQAPMVNPGSPPTYHRTNKFTTVYQGLVDTYGVARYQEINPGLFTIVTFPFLFGVMYGDFGHGIFLTLFSSYLLWNEKHLNEQKKRGQMNEIMAMIFGGRYMLILMGLFAIYVGTIYNDCMAVPLHLFDSMWEAPANNQTTMYTRKEGRVYPWGIDYEWYNKKNMSFFFNSLKMKLSVILGVTQMMFGLFLSAANHIYFKDRVSLIFEFIPQFLFLSCTFGYMVLMILMKWCMDWPNPSLAPSLLQTMIKMFLDPFHVEFELYSGQQQVQNFLVLIALCSVPIMLFVKPWMQHREAQKRHGAGMSGQHFSLQDDAVTLEMNSSDDNFGDDSAHHHGPSDGHEEHSFGDLMIHQCIHTIEFILGSVSNTASYLRLWALSLAHAQLASVFWDKMMMSYGVEMFPYVGPLIGFCAWFAATFFVLLCMDVLECFLHALRLHWVEFQNKFYKADGYIFAPFTFAKKEEDN